MNILFCYDIPICREFGGVASVSYTLLQGFKSRGHNCYAVSAIHKDGIICEYQYFLPNSVKDSDDNDNRIWFQGFLSRKSIDIIINQNALESASEWPIVWSRGMKARVLTVYHNSPFSMYACNEKHIRENGIVKSLKLQPLFDSLWRRMFRFKYGKKFKRSIIQSDRVVMLSSSYFKELSWFSRLEVNSKYVAIPNPALERFNIKLSQSTKRKEAVFVGRLNRQKRLDYLIDIWGKVIQHRSDWHLNIVGNGEFRKELENQVKEKNILGISFEGYQDPLDYYKRASIFCMTSDFEGFPGVLPESMSCGCVPIVFNSYASASDIIDDGKNGFLVTPGDLVEYTKLLGTLMDDESLRTEMSLRAKEKSATFSLNNVVTQWENQFVLVNDKI